MGWLAQRYEHVNDAKEREEKTGTRFDRKKYPGKTTCNASFLHAFMVARDRAIKSGLAETLKGFGAWKITPLKEDLK